MSDLDVAYARAGFLLAGVKDIPDTYSPHFPPIPRDDYDALPDLYRAIVPWRWTGDVFYIDDARALEGMTLTDVSTPGRVYFDAGLVTQLKACGFAGAYWQSCPVPQDALLQGFLGRIAANRKQMQQAFGALLDGVAAVVSFVPVIGQAVAVLLSAAAAIATERPLSDAVIGAVIAAVPGGKLVQDSVSPAVAFGKAIVQGRTIDEASIAAARELARKVGGDAAALAFDLVLAIAQGRDLQEAGFALVNYWLPGGTDITSRAARFSSKVAQAAARGQSVERLFLEEAKAGLAALPLAQDAQAKIDGAVNALLAEPRRYLGSMNALASELGIPLEAAQAAFMSVVYAPDGELRLNESYRWYLRSNVDPRAPIEGEAEGIEAARRWASRKIPLRELAFTQARELSYASKLAAKPAQAMFTPGGKTLVEAAAKPFVLPTAPEMTPEPPVEIYAPPPPPWPTLAAPPPMALDRHADVFVPPEPEPGMTTGTKVILAAGGAAAVASVALLARKRKRRT